MPENSMNLKEVFKNVVPENDTVFIVGHDKPDLDSVGSAMGIALLCMEFKKPVYIIINDNYGDIEAGARRVIDSVRDKFNIITLSQCEELLTDKSLLITTDVNGKDRISVRDILDRFNEVIVIDHHKPNIDTIARGIKFIDENYSSASEIVTHLLRQIDPVCASYLLAGILLDTERLRKNVKINTAAAMTKLIKNGADTEITNDLFKEDFEHDRAIQKIIDNTYFISHTIAIACNSQSKDKFCLPEDLAKAADYLLRYTVDAAFSLGFVSKDVVSISARSKGVIDVGNIMQRLGGGGSKYSAATKIHSCSLEEVDTLLKNVLVPGSTIDMPKVLTYDKK